MPVSEGVLNGLGGGNVISGAGSGYRVDGDRVVRTGVDIQRSWVQWQVADIGTTPKRGVDKAPGIMFASIVWLFQFAIAAVVIGAIIGVITQVLFQTFLPGLVVGLGWLAWGIVTIRNMRAAAGALGPARRN